MSADSVHDDDMCYGAGAIAASVVITIIIICLLLIIAYFMWKRFKEAKGKNLVLETDPERGKNSYAFDNDGFTDGGTPFEQTLEKPSKLESTKSKWSQWSPITALLTKNEKQKTMDDSALQVGEIKTISLKSHDFTGLGFNIYGNMREGIFVKDILNRGPAFESGKLNPGDRIKSVTINFDHVVYEDALTILSYASPYEVVIEAISGKLSGHQIPVKMAQLGHPMYRSSSAIDLTLIEKTAKKRLFVPSPYSTLQKSSSNATTLERKDSLKTDVCITSEDLKLQLEEKLAQNHKQQLQTKEAFADNEIEEAPKTENKYQKFGIKVLPIESFTLPQLSPKSNELSQNDNNINIEIHLDTNSVAVGVDEVDKIPPPIRKREKSKQSLMQEDEESNFVRQDSLSSSGIKRDKDGIPQEIPNHMLNAAVAARKNRRAFDDVVTDDVKSPKKPKGRAPAPPDSRSSLEVQSEKSTDYASDSDIETDNQSSVNTIELNSNDITVHQSEEVEDVQNRKTASTGDLTKIQKNLKINSSTLERAQSLDITDTAMPALSKKIKNDSKSGSEDSLYGKALAEPRLSLALDGLNTFQRSRLKKSTEWGNLEDAILNMDTSDGNLNQSNTIEQSSHLNALVDKINEIKHEVPVDSASIEINVSDYDGNNVWSASNVSNSPVLTSRTSITLDHSQEDPETDSKIETTDVVHLDDFLNAEKSNADFDPYYDVNKYDINVSDDIKVSRHSLTPSEKPFDSLSNISNITVNSTNINETVPVDVNLDSDEFYITAIDKTIINNSILNDDGITVNEMGSKVTIEGPTSLTVQINDPEPVSLDNTLYSNKTINISPSSKSDNSQKSNYSLTYITEIQVTPTPNNTNNVEIPSSPESESPSNNSQTISPIIDTIDVEKELHKIQEIAEEQLKKLPEMRFSTSSYEAPKVAENYSSHIEQLRSNFEKSPSKSSLKLDTGVAKSRIPVATTKTPPTSPERRDSRNFDAEIDKDIVAMMSSPIHSTPVSNLKFQPKTANKNVSVTSIRTNSKIPSGLPNRPPIPPRKYDYEENLTRISTNGNGNSNSSFKQWVFNPGDNTVTNITVSESKFDRK
ncbi:hypothetical protein FQA39_LY16605 [Lamprigera yunnana]|nr:hypothetical protein FQA39_LY16605 [Lamprigera yunnana]